MTDQINSDEAVDFAESEELNNNIFWLHSAHPSSVNRILWRFLTPTAPGHETFRLELGVGINTPIIPIFPNTENRVDYIKYLTSLKTLDALIVVVGDSQDWEDKRVQKLYQGVAIWAHPAERQYYIDTMSDSAAPSYNQAKETKEEWKASFAKKFNEVIEVR